jgi:hypothetical protein
MIEVQLPERTIQLPVSPAHDCAYKFTDYNGGSHLVADAVTGQREIGADLTTDETRIIEQQVPAQTAALLQVAHVLHLQPLLDALHRFIRLSTWASDSIFIGSLDAVFADAVVEAALGSSTVSKAAYISSVLTQPCSLVESYLSPQGLLKPVGDFKINPRTGSVTVQAQLLREFAGAKAGEVVDVELELFTSDGLALHLQLPDHPRNDMGLAGRLLLGNTIGDDGQLAIC